MKSLIVCYSYHHNNTQRVAEAMAKVLDAQVTTPQQTNPEELQQFDLVGFGSGIYAEKHHESLLELADKLPQVTDKKTFIFSTSFVVLIRYSLGKLQVNFTQHLGRNCNLKATLLLMSLIAKAFNTNRIYGRFGGMNKGRPNAEDLKHAEEFALKLKQST